MGVLNPAEIVAGGGATQADLVAQGARINTQTANGYRLGKPWIAEAALWAYGALTENLKLSAASVTDITCASNSPALSAPSSAARPTLASNRTSFDGVDDILAQTFDRGTATYVSAQTLPDGGTGSDTGKGFTCTGLYRRRAGGWIVGNHGIPQEGGPTGSPSVCILSDDFTALLNQFPMSAYTASLFSVQGVAEGPDNTIYVVHRDGGTANTIYKLQADGTFIAKLTLGYAPNGLAFDTKRGLLIVGGSSDQVLRWIDPTTGATVFTRTVSNTPDQLFYDAELDWVWFSGGANGIPGKVRGYDIIKARVRGTLVMSNTLAIEGLHRSGTRWTVMHDGYYHNAAPLLNQSHFYDATSLGGVALGGRYLLAMIFSIPAAPSATVTLLGAGNPLAATGNADVGINDVGFSISKTSGNTNVLRLIGSKGPDSGNRSSVDVTSPVALTTETLAVVDVDHVAQTCTVYINGAVVGTANAMTNLSPTVVPQNILATVGGAIENGVSARFSRPSLAAVAIVPNGYKWRQQIEGQLCWDTDTQALLPSGHPFQTYSPA